MSALSAQSAQSAQSLQSTQATFFGHPAGDGCGAPAAVGDGGGVAGVGFVDGVGEPGHALLTGDAAGSLDGVGGRGQRGTGDGEIFEAGRQRCDGGGGAGAQGPSGVGLSGTANTGGGGGSGYNTGNQTGSGGSGIVIVRYLA